MELQDSTQRHQELMDDIKVLKERLKPHEHVVSNVDMSRTTSTSSSWSLGRVRSGGSVSSRFIAFCILSCCYYWCCSPLLSPPNTGESHMKSKLAKPKRQGSFPSHGSPAESPNDIVPEESPDHTTGVLEQETGASNDTNTRRR